MGAGDVLSITLTVLSRPATVLIISIPVLVPKLTSNNSQVK